MISRPLRVPGTGILRESAKSLLCGVLYFVQWLGTYDEVSVWDIMHTQVFLALSLKVPKRENFSLAFFTLSEPIWVCDLGTGTKIDVFINWPLISKVFWLFAAYSVCGKKEKKLKVDQN
jgi:hypothetical protein